MSNVIVDPGDHNDSQRCSETQHMDRGLRTLISFEFSETISPGAQAFQELDTHYMESRDGVAMEGFHLPTFSVQEGSWSKPGN